MASGDLNAARRTCRSALKKAEDLNGKMSSNFAVMSEIELLRGDVRSALYQADRARQEKEVGAQWDTNNLYGVAAMRSDMTADAEAVFREALQQCNTWLERSDRHISAYSGKGLALSGLLGCGVASVAEEAAGTYSAAGRLYAGPCRGGPQAPF
jgi:hypothetical protein